MLYVCVDTGCIECGEESKVIGLFSVLDRAKEAAEREEKYQEAHWTGQHRFEIFPVEAVDVDYGHGVSSDA
jgi:hypothetical protein